MPTIPAALVKQLRDETGVGMMECKKALLQANGDKTAAITLLREHGASIAAKKSARTAKQGIIAATVHPGPQQTGVMIEVNCETDFVAKNQNFQAFVQSLLADARTIPNDTLAQVAKNKIAQKIAEIGENIVARRNVSLTLDGPGLIASYVHMGGKFGVLVLVRCEKPETQQNPAFRTLAADLALQITAAAPLCVSPSQLPPALVENERAIYRKQVENKPPAIVDKIVQGKLAKYYSQVCLLEQEFVRDSAKTIARLLAETSKTLNDTITVDRFVRWQLGA